MTVCDEDGRRGQLMRSEVIENLLGLQARVDHQAVASSLHLGDVCILLEGVGNDGGDVNLGRRHKLPSPWGLSLGKLEWLLRGCRPCGLTGQIKLSSRGNIVIGSRKINDNG